MSAPASSSSAPSPAPPAAANQTTTAASASTNLVPFLRADWNPPPVEGRRTRIVCTIGPKTQSKDAMNDLMNAGMNVVRMNFSHGTHEFHGKTIAAVREACAESKRICAILLDTKGPEIRSGKLQGGGEIQLDAGQEFTLTTDRSHIGDKACVSVDYANLPKVIDVGKRVLIDDGLISLRVTEKGDTFVKGIIENSAMLGETKGVNLPGVTVDLPAVTEQDVRDILFGVENNVDFIAASFIRKAEDVLRIREILASAGGEHIKIISKIESQEGLDNFDAILEASDGIMVARGDLGVEIPIEKVGLAQKMMIHKCNAVGKPVITATQMLETMIHNPRPTRAEATDILNAVLDGTDCVMLSGETAKGAYPLEAVRVMSQVCVHAEMAYDYRAAFNVVRSYMLQQPRMPVADAIAASSVSTGNDLRAGLIITLSETGNTARLVAKYRPMAPIFCITSNKDVARQLLVSRSIFPVVVGTLVGVDNVITRTIQMAKQRGVVKPGDFVVVASGTKLGPSGLSNVIKVHTVE